MNSPLFTRSCVKARRLSPVRKRNECANRSQSQKKAANVVHLDFSANANLRLRARNFFNRAAICEAQARPENHGDTRFSVLITMRFVITCYVLWWLSVESRQFQKWLSESTSKFDSKFCCFCAFQPSNCQTTAPPGCPEAMAICIL